MQQIKRKKWMNLLLLCGLGFFVTIGALCPTDLDSTLSIVVKQPVEFSVQSSNSSFNQVYEFDLAEELQEEIASDSRLSASMIEDVSVTGVTFVVLNNNSATGTTVSGQVKIGQSSETLTTLIELLDFDLDANVGVEQTPVPEEAGMTILVNIINSLFDNAGKLKSDNVPATVSLMGSAEPAPPPDLDFDVRVWLHLSVTGKK